MNSSTLFEIILDILAKWFSRPVKVNDSTHDTSTPDTTVAVVSPVIKTNNNRPYMTAGVVSLLALIRLHESGSSGYDADYRNDDHFGPLENLTFDRVRVLGRSQVSLQHEASSAIGAYQFLTATLDSLKVSLKLVGTEFFTHTFQDDLAVALMIRRGFMKFKKKEISVETFANNLAQEWASLPVVTMIKSSSGKVLRVGQSYYAGDGLNAALHKPETILKVIKQIGAEQ